MENCFQKINQKKTHWFQKRPEKRHKTWKKLKHLVFSKLKPHLQGFWMGLTFYYWSEHFVIVASLFCLLQFLLIPCCSCLPLHYLHKSQDFCQKASGFQVTGRVISNTFTFCMYCQSEVSKQYFLMHLIQGMKKKCYFNVTPVILVFSPEFLR